jgi:hypothetical protein
MRLLSRHTPPPIDAHLTYFTLSEAAEFRRLVERAFTAAGRDVAVHPEFVEDRGGTTFQLWNIGALCVGVSRSEWPALIDEHIALVTTPVRGLEQLTPSDVESGVHLRLVDAASVPDPDSVAYARIVAPGLLEVLSVDLADSVVTPTREELGAHGSLGRLLARGRENLRALLAEGTVSAETVGDGRPGRFTAVSGDSTFTASLALLLAETVRCFTAEDDWGLGYLVSVPFRHRLLYRTIGGSDSALALERMQHAALAEFASAPGALSPDVFWVRDRKWVQVTSSASGKPRVLRESGLREMLKSL